MVTGNDTPPRLGWRKKLLPWVPQGPSGHAAQSDESADEADVAVSVMIEENKAGTTRETDAPKSGRHLAFLLMLGAVFSKALGFVREISMAHVFGASMIADGFRAAITGTILPLALMQNETVPTILIPMYRNWQEEGKAAKNFAALTLALTLVGFAIMSLVIGFCPLFVRTMVGGFSPEAQQITLEFLRITALGMPASVMLNVLAAAEIALGRSRLTTLRASLLNVSVIVGLIVLVFTGWRDSLAWAFALGFNGLGAWGVATLIRDGSLDFRGLRPAHVVQAAYQFWLRLRPLMAVPIADQANVWIERILASHFGVGTVASMDYARTISESAVLFVSQPLGLALLSAAPTTDYSARMQALARPLLAVVLPASVCLGIFAPDVARFVFSRGAFNDQAVFLTGEALRGISLGLWATTLGWVLLRMLNSVGRNTAAALILVSAYMANLLANLLLSQIHSSTFDGPLLLGFGEAIRGFVLLGATVAVMRCGREMLKLLVLAAIPALAMGVFGWIIDEMVTGTVYRLILAGLGCGVSIMIGGYILAPQIYSSLMSRLRGSR